MKPIIGVTGSMEVDEKYYMIGKDNMEAITQTGGIPVMLPYLRTKKDIDELALQLNGLYLTGGYDIDATLFGEEPHPNLGTIIPERDQFELKIISKMLQLNKPILAVCRGCQILNIAAGGDMYQDIYGQIDTDLLQHQQNAPQGYGSHFVNIQQGSLLHQVTEAEKIRVNSRHHQANRYVVQPFAVSGQANDGIIEAIESKEHAFVLGLQWHPENMFQVGDKPSKNIYQAFIKATKG